MLNIGLVGVRRGHTIVQLKDRDDVHFAAACDLKFLDADGRADFAKDWAADGIEFDELYSHYDEFLKHDLDVVMIATPPAFHASQSIAALRSGRDVMCEVPAVMSIEEGRELVAAVRETGGKYLFLENCCYWGFALTWKKMIAEGRLGKVFHMEGEYIHDCMKLVSNEDGSPTWRSDFEPIRYVTHETGPLLNMIDDRGVSVTAMESLVCNAPAYKCANAQVALLKTANGTLIKLLTSFANAGEEFHRYYVMGTDGTLETKTTEPVTYARLNDIPNLTGPVKMPLGINETGLTADKIGGHGTADWRLLNIAIDAIVNDEPAPIDVYRALDYSLPGVCAVESIKQGGMAVEIPDPRTFQQ